MQFRLLYEGSLPPKKMKAAGEDWRLSQHKRCQNFHQQLSVLWNQQRLSSMTKYLDADYQPNDCYLVQRVDKFDFAPLVSDKISVVAELDILMLRCGSPGSLIKHGGDLDNCAKTLIDSLCVPKAEQLPAGVSLGGDERPFLCVLQDDALVTRVNIESDCLLRPPSDDHSWVSLFVQVTIRAKQLTWANMSIV